MREGGIDPPPSWLRQSFAQNDRVQVAATTTKYTMYNKRGREKKFPGGGWGEVLYKVDGSIKI